MYLPMTSFILRKSFLFRKHMVGNMPMTVDLMVVAELSLTNDEITFHDREAPCASVTKTDEVKNLSKSTILVPAVSSCNVRLRLLDARYD